MKKISILGSTGSIGTSALQVVDHLGSSYKVAALASHSRIDLLEEQILKYKPKIAAVFDVNKAEELKRKNLDVKIVSGIEGLKEAAAFSDADLTLSAISGTNGLIPTLAAIKAGKDIALANKETLVSGGRYVLDLASQHKVRIIPVDSEHSAIYQCLIGESPDSVARLILTASGGPFRNCTSEELKHVTVDMALNHPTWKMGPKISIDSSTLMNKGLEMIEAHYLFDVKPENIDLVIHPQSVIHSFVEFIDGSLKAQLSKPDMRLPIQYAFTFPERKQGALPLHDFALHGKLEFFPADRLKFRCLSLCYEALKEGGTLPGYMNAANEVLVSRFLNKEISWLEIAVKLEALMQKHQVQRIENIEMILEVETQAKEEAKKI